MKQLIDQYEKEYPFYQILTDRLQSLLSVLLKNQELHIHSVIGRTKNKTSLENKILNAKDKYHNLSDITDLCGLRIITYYEAEVDKVAKFIRKHFKIDEENSVDKRKALAADRFGYLSLHLIVDLSPELNLLSHGEDLPDCKIEIQIRSILQHAWAEIEHDLEYKNRERETYETRRHFSRLAGLLEIADLEFEKLRLVLNGQTAPLPLASAGHSALPALSVPPQCASHAPAKLPSWGWAACFVACSLTFSILLDLCFGNKILHLASLLFTVG